MAIIYRVTVKISYFSMDFMFEDCEEAVTYAIQTKANHVKGKDDLTVVIEPIVKEA